MGRSGTGKTTLLKVLGGLRDATPGSVVRAAGAPVDGPPEGVIFVFQDYSASLLPWRTVERNVSLGLEGRLERPQLEQRVTEALEMVGLADRRRDYPWQLSGGMQQRVQLARSLAMRASVLLMDEPFGSLDAMTKAALQDELQQVHQDTRGDGRLRHARHRRGDLPQRPHPDPRRRSRHDRAQHPGRPAPPARPARHEGAARVPGAAPHRLRGDRRPCVGSRRSNWLGLLTMPACSRSGRRSSRAGVLDYEYLPGADRPSPRPPAG